MFSKSLFQENTWTLTRHSVCSGDRERGCHGQSAFQHRGEGGRRRLFLAGGRDTRSGAALAQVREFHRAFGFFDAGRGLRERRANAVAIPLG